MYVGSLGIIQLIHFSVYTFFDNSFLVFHFTDTLAQPNPTQSTLQCTMRR